MNAALKYVSFLFLGAAGINVAHANGTDLAPRSTANFVATPIPEPAEMVGTPLKNPPFRMIGVGEEKKVVDGQGNGVIAYRQGRHPWEVKVAPDGEAALVRMSDSADVVIYPQSNAKLTLPLMPPHKKNAFKIDWCWWLGPDRLFGISGLAAPPEPGIGCTGDSDPLINFFYIYDLKSKRLIEVKPTHAGLLLRVDINQASPDGRLHLMESKRNVDTSTDLGWFKVELKP